MPYTCIHTSMYSELYTYIALNTHTWLYTHTHTHLSSRGLGNGCRLESDNNSFFSTGMHDPDKNLQPLKFEFKI